MLDFAASFYLPTRSTRTLRIPAIATLMLLMSGAGCRREQLATESVASTAWAQRLRVDFALVPADAGIVLSVDLDRLRASPMWNALASGPGKDAAILFEEFAKGTGIDLLRQLRHILVALPGEGQGDRRFALIAEIDSLDEARATAWLRQRKGGAIAAFVTGGSRIVLAQGAWVSAVSTLARKGGATPSAANVAELRRLCEHAADDHVFWVAAIVPVTLRRELITGGRFPDVASLTRLWGSIDLGAGLRAQAVAELSNEVDARTLARRLNAYLNTAKHHPDMLAHGFSPYLEAVRLVARGPRVRATLELPAAQQEDVIDRLDALVRASTMGPSASP